MTNENMIINSLFQNFLKPVKKVKKSKWDKDLNKLLKFSFGLELIKAENSLKELKKMKKQKNINREDKEKGGV